MKIDVQNKILDINATAGPKNNCAIRYVMQTLTEVNIALRKRNTCSDQPNNEVVSEVCQK